MKPLVVCTEGNVGSGKSSFLKRFHGMEEVEILPEPVEEWRDVSGFNLLKMMYEQSSKWLFQFQSYCTLTLLQQHMSAQGRLKIMERSLYSSRNIFIEHLQRVGLLHRLEVHILDKWINCLFNVDSIKTDVDLFIYLRCNPEIAYGRMLERGRAEEKEMPLSYLESLHLLHETWLVEERESLPAPVVYIDANKTQEELNVDFERILERIDNMLKG